MVEIPVFLGIYTNKKDKELAINPRPCIRVAVTYEDARKLFSLEHALSPLGVVDASITYVSDVEGKIVGDLDPITLSNELEKSSNEFISSTAKYFAKRVFDALSNIKVFSVRKESASTFIEVPVFLDVLLDEIVSTNPTDYFVKREE